MKTAAKERETRVRVFNFRWTFSTAVTQLCLVMSCMTSLCVCEIFTSSEKILELASKEAELLDILQMHIHNEYDNLKALSGFLSERSKVFRMMSEPEIRALADHPNGAFHLIKLYTTEWQNLATANPVFAKHIAHLTPDLPSEDDYIGACGAIVRLQRMYRLQPSDMMSGNYSGYLGPPLSPEDAFDIGRQAFVDGFLKESCEWLTQSVTSMEIEEFMKGRQLQQLRSQKGQAYGLLGRTYYFMNDTNKARELYETAITFDDVAGDIIQLQKELTDVSPAGGYGSAVEDFHANMSELCSWDKEQRVDSIRPYHVCRYKPSLSIPYLRFKEEILSMSPYASVFYDIINDDEIHALTGHVRGKMYRGQVGIGKNATVAPIRTGDLGWIFDDDLSVAAKVSVRVKEMTGLDVAQRVPHGPSSAEAFQIVNYGMGGHYDVHMDTFNVSKTPEETLLSRSGDRIATFLMYLSDVEKGGHTVFVRSKISVAPKKGMALLWYNFDPKMEEDLQTHHAGCPVLIGHKWIANKWIWTYGNTFRRRCGLSPSATQQDIEPIMYDTHKHSDMHG